MTNIEKGIEAFKKGLPFQSGSVSSVYALGRNTLYSYATPIAVRYGSNKKVFLNVDGYSNTTSKLQNAVRREFSGDVQEMDEGELRKILR